MRFSRSFYAQPADVVARALLGSRLCVRHAPGDVRVGRIVETEAYMGPHDLASHARFGKTRRNAVMFGPPGHAYVFLIYGMHSCLNVVTSPEGNAQAVLLRALEPIANLERSAKGPGRLCQALGVDRGFNGEDFRGRHVWIEKGPVPIERVKVTARIGVDYAGQWKRRRLRYCLAGNAYVSGPVGMK
jgi:DNA-3-methyladenine glycosylase